MVSKTTKKTPLSIRMRRKKTPAKAVSTVSSILHSWHKKLVKIFSKLSRIRTPSPKHKKNKSLFKKYNKYELLSTYSPRKKLFPSLLPPSTVPEKKTLFLDLDETLIHSVSYPEPEKYDFIVRPDIDGVRVDFYVRKRPFVDEFLEFVSEKFEIVVFTAGLEAYAKLVLDILDKKGLVKYRLYRDSCREIDGKFVKDLGEVGRDLDKVAIVDDNPFVYALHSENAIPIKPFVDDERDIELKRLMEFFKGCDEAEDMRDVMKQYRAGLNEENGDVL